MVHNVIVMLQLSHFIRSHIYISESHTPVQQNTSKCYMKTSDILYLPLKSVYKTSTSPDRVTCEKQCLEEKDMCGATVFMQYINSTCTFLRQSDDALYQPIQLKDTIDIDDISAKVSMRVCQKGNGRFFFIKNGLFI